MDEITIELRIYSPRWDHEDSYIFELSQEKLDITQGPRSTRAIWSDRFDPEWSGELLADILQNDSIYPPAVLQRMIEYAWRSWRNGDLSDKEIDEELQAVGDWLNTITKSKPRTKFWAGYF